MTAHMRQEVLLGIATGTISGQKAFSSGRIRVEGEATLEVYLGQFFSA
jgi:putative sterol carrier protein